MDSSGLIALAVCLYFSYVLLIVAFCSLDCLIVGFLAMCYCSDIDSSHRLYACAIFVFTSNHITHPYSYCFFVNAV